MGPGLLASELIAGEQEDPQLGILGRQLHQPGVVDVCLASLGGHVDDAENVSPIPLQIHVLAVDILDSELVHSVRCHDCVD